jgi:uncharacterized protein
MSLTDEQIARILGEAERIRELGASAPRLGRDPVNQPMINNWTEAIGDANPTYREGVAPPAMIQVWTMPGLHGTRAADDPLSLVMGVFDEAGYTSIVATNCEQTYHRALQLGDHVSVTTSLESVIGPKQTGLGEGWFVTTRNVWLVGDEPVAEMMFRVLKFRPGRAAEPAQPEPARVVRPMISQDTAFFWEGTAAGELRVQRCPSCGTLRHPPGPMCPSCGADKPDYVVASGLGTVFSYVVHHHPKVPGKNLPIVIALVELEEGVRMLGELLDVAPDEVQIGMPVEIALTRIDDDLTLPYWRPRAAAQGAQ